MHKWKELFTVPEDRKMTEKDLMRVLFSSVSCILMCMVCLASTTWALFSVTITSDNNAIQLGEFTTAVKVTRGEEEVLPVEDGYILGEGAYVLSITNTGNCRGYAEILVTDGSGETTAYYTGTIPVGGTAGVNILITGEGVELALNQTWGACPDPEHPVTVITAEGITVPTDSIEDAEKTTDPAEDPEETTAPSEIPEEITEPSEIPEETIIPSQPEENPNLV